MRLIGWAVAWAVAGLVVCTLLSAGWWLSLPITVASGVVGVYTWRQDEALLRRVRNWRSADQWGLAFNGLPFGLETWRTEEAAQFEADVRNQQRQECDRLPPAWTPVKVAS